MTYPPLLKKPIPVKKQTPVQKNTTVQKSTPINSPLNMFDVEEEEDYGFKVKPEFSGKRGEKLMKLQAKFGGDDRFKMDQKFVDEDEAVSSESSSEDDSDKEMEVERAGQKGIMDSVLSDMGIFTKTHAKQKLQVIEDQVRFDPTNEEHDKFVVKHEEPAKEEEDEAMEEDEEEEVALPLVSTDTFFEVKTNFNELMKTDTQSEAPKTSFSFGFTVDVAEEAPLEQAKELNIPELRARYDSSDGEEEEEEKVRLPKLTIDKPFFLYTAHPDGKWKNKVNFMRTEPMFEIESEWLAKREALTQEYKKRHRDAVRFQKKLKVKER